MLHISQKWVWRSNIKENFVMIMTSLVCLVMQLEAAHSGRFEVALKSNEACQSAPIKRINAADASQWWLDHVLSIKESAPKISILISTLFSIFQLFYFNCIAALNVTISACLSECYQMNKIWERKEKSWILITFHMKSMQTFITPTTLILF